MADAQQTHSPSEITMQSLLLPQQLEPVYQELADAGVAPEVVASDIGFVIRFAPNISEPVADMTGDIWVFIRRGNFCPVFEIYESYAGHRIADGRAWRGVDKAMRRAQSSAERLQRKFDKAPAIKYDIHTEITEQ